MRNTVPAGFLIAALSLGVAGCGSQADPQQAPPKAPYEFIASWGEKGTGPGKLSSPRAITTDRYALVYVADGGGRSVHKFDARGQPLLSFENAGIRSPGGIAVDSGGGIFVTDRERAAVLVFGYDGRHIGTLRGGAGQRFRDPCHIVVDATGDIYVADLLLNRIQQLTPRGRLLSSWARSDSASGLTGGVSAMAIGEDGVLYVADADGRRIQKLSALSGTMAVETFTELPEPAGAVGALALGRRHIFALDVKLRSIRSWTSDGKRGPEIGLAPFLSVLDEPLQGMVLVPGREILVLTSAPRVLRFRLNF